MKSERRPEPFYSAGLRTAALLLVLMSMATYPERARASETDRKAAHFASNAGSLLYAAAGVGLPLLEDGRSGRERSLRVLDAFLTSELLTLGMKEVVNAKRPDTDERDSFPSGHAAGAFAIATMQSAFHPEQAPYWYLGSTLIAASRVRLRRHFVHDVVGGAALGYFIARWELRSRRGLLLAPFISPESEGVGLQLHARF
jgi:membrane-associated phospholipid phosphatase